MNGEKYRGVALCMPYLRLDDRGDSEIGIVGEIDYVLRETITFVKCIKRGICNDPMPFATVKLS